MRQFYVEKFSSYGAISYNNDMNKFGYFQIHVIGQAPKWLKNK